MREHATILLAAKELERRDKLSKHIRPGSEAQ
jgi:hypothetical protein